MRLTIFWRMAFVQLVLIALCLAMLLSVLSQLREQSGLEADLLATHAARASEEQRLLDIFFFQRRSAEKYLLLRDAIFLDHFIQGAKEFRNSLDTISSLTETAEEHTLVSQIRTLHARYSDGLGTSGALLETWKQERAEIGERIVAALQDLLRLGEARGEAAAMAKGKTVSSPLVLGWLLAGGLGLMAALLYLNARWLSRPLKQLSQEMRRVSQGELRRSLHVRGASEIAEVLRAFNQMTERLTELDEMQGDFLAQMSHELRTPLTAIQEGSALLLEEIPGALNTAQREIVQVVRMNSERLFRRLVSLLDLSKMEARKVEYALMPTDLTTLVRRSAESIGPIAQKKQLQISLHAPAPLPTLYVDEDRIRQVLDNLLSNAVKFTPEKGKIRVSTVLRYDAESEERWAEVRVSDSGVGVPPEDAERIFLKFYQGSPTRGQAWRGSGLGLAISRHIVEAHGGKIWVESRPGEGATFVFTLPLRNGRENNHRREEQKQRNGGRNAM